MFASLNLGIGLIIGGLVFVILVWAVLRLLPHAPIVVAARTAALPVDSPDSGDAIVVIQSGGRVEYVSGRAREWFDLSASDAADLDGLVRRVRPPDDFLDVCAEPGNKRLMINGRPVEATSYRVPGAIPQMLLSLRSLDLGPAMGLEGAGASSSLLKVVNEFSAHVASSLDIESVARSILESTLRLLPADLLEVRTWEQDSRSLVAYRFEQSNGAAPKIVRTVQSQFGLLTRRVEETRSAVLLADAASLAVKPGEVAHLGLTSYLGIPLMAGAELAGILEAGQTTGTPFTQRDLDLMQLVCAQTGAALRNAMLYEQERRRTAELYGLANVSQAIVAIREPEELFTRLVDSVASLFDAEIVGFLLYDETEHTLSGQVPFRGLPAHIVRIYRSRVTPGSPAEVLMRQHQPILTSNAAEDENWRLLGLDHVAVAASLRDSALIPLVSAGRMVGYFQLSHRRQGEPRFSDSDLHLLNIVADQAAAIIDNALLVRQNAERIRRSEALRRLYDLSASSATVDEALARFTKELAGVFQCETAGIFLLDETRGELRLHADSAVGFSRELLASQPSLVVDAPEYLQTVSGSRRPVLSGRLNFEKELPSFYWPLVRGLGLESSIFVPLVAHARSLGELMLGSRRSDLFGESDLQLLTTCGGQVAETLGTLRMAAQTDLSLRRRVDQLTSIARVSRELGGALSVEHLLRVIHDETLRATGAECGSILLLESDEAGADASRPQSVGCDRGDVLSELERRSVDSRESSLISDFGTEHIPPPHAGVRSGLLVPVVVDGRSIGLIQLHAPVPGAFDADALETAQTLAIQAGAALANARQVQEERRQAELLRRRAETLEKFSGTSYGLNPDLPLEDQLTAIAQGIRDSTPFRVILISVYETETGLLRRVTGAGIAPDTLAELQARKQQLASLRQLLKPEFRISHSYYIPANETPVLPADIHYVYASQYSETEAKQNAWDPDDFLLMPLEDPDGNPLGLISLDDPSNGLRPDRATIDSVELFAGQAIQVLSNSRRMVELNARIESLTSGLNRQQQLLSVTQNDLPVLLRKDLEQTIALHNLDRRAQRVRAGLMITESVSRQLDVSSALLALGRETLTQLGMSVALVAESTAEGSRLVHVLGAVPVNLNAEALFGQRNPLRAALQTGVPILLPNVDESDEWRDTSLLSQLRAKGVICLPVLVENQPVAAMLATSTEPLPALTDEDRQVYYQIARQASVVLQNISLLNETRRRLHEVNILLEFSRRLSGLDSSQIVTALLDSSRHALAGAHAGVVFLWNDQSGSLEPRAASGYADDDSMLGITYRGAEALPGTVFLSSKPRRVDEIDFARDYALRPENLGLYRRATGGRLPVSSLLLPIVVEEQRIGLIVLDNFNTVAAFRPEDEALMVSLSQQAALSLENVRLVGAMTERAGQLQALNQVATTLTSSLRSDELVAGLLDELGLVLPFDTATLWLRDSERLTVAAARGFPDAEKRLGLVIAVAESALFQDLIKSGQPISVPDVREDPRFPQLEAPRLSWLGIPMVAKGELIGMIALEKWQASFYSRDQVQLGATLASQAGIALENANLYEESLRRAAELDERSQRLGLLNRFSSGLSGLLDAGQILALTAEEMQSALRARRVVAVSFDRGQAWAVAASPKSDQRLPQEVPDAPLFGRLRDSLGIFSTDNAKSESDLRPLREFMGPETTGLLVLPLSGGKNLLAVLFAYNAGKERFRATEIELARTIANQASIALENARLYQSTVRTAERLALLNHASAEIGTNLDAEEIYRSIHQAAERLMPVDTFVISLLDEERQEVENVYSRRLGLRLPVTRAPLGEGLSSRVILTGEPELLNGPQQLDASEGAPQVGASTALSTLAVPMILGNRALGMLAARSREANVYSREDLQILGTLANQAVVSIQNGRLFGETERLAQELEQRVVERTAQLRHEQQNTETLLRILTEVSASLDLDRALNRTLSLLNDAVRAEQGTIMLLSPEGSTLHYRAGYGYLTDRARSEERALTLKVGEGLAGWVVQNREAVLVDDVRRDPRWLASSASSREHRSAIAAPLLVADDVIGVLMVFSRAEAYFTAEGLSLVKAIASQVAVAINNAHLYELIRDQAERLGVMLRKEQEEASRSQAILESVADGVLVSGPDNRITFLNSSVQRILGVPAGRLLGQSVEEFGGLFGEAGSTWLETVRRWSESRTAHEVGDTYAERLELGNDRIGLIHLAPVVLEDDFLGTVSILRDITREVEVDRLKSEFVATVSHELRTPMTSIKGYVEMLLMGAAGAINENQSHFLDIVKGNIDRLNTLVGDLLDISRIEAGKVTLSTKALDLRQIATDAIAEMQQASNEDKKPIAFSLKASRDLPPVVGDGERVRQIILSLLDNAYHYTPENGSVQVHLRKSRKRGEVQVDIVDDGLGIPAGEQQRVFERFYRGENPLVLATPGTGLGLSIVKQLVEMHHGRVWLGSDGVAGHGSTFSFTLPVVEEADDAVSPPRRTAK
jgi:PAS domain S-box-containing protein